VGEFGEALRRITRPAVSWWPEFLLVVVAVVVVGLLWHGSCPVSSLSERELMQTSYSPGGDWVVDVWYDNPGAWGSASVAVEARRAGKDSGREILRLYSDDLARAKWANDNDLLIEWHSTTSLSVGGFAAHIYTGSLWGLVLVVVGSFLVVRSMLGSGFVLYRRLFARSRLLCRDWVYITQQVVGLVLVALGVLWAAGVI
jgi:hypothetical protein